MITATTNSNSQAVEAGGEAQDRDWLLTAGGATLLLLALSKRKTIGMAALLGGGYLLYRSYLKGNLGNLAGFVPDSLHLPNGLSLLGCGSSSSPVGQCRKEWYPPEDADPVDQASMNSFPTSDPPSNY